MLAMYAALDPRVQFLGYMMKVFAKVCQKYKTEHIKGKVNPNYRIFCTKGRTAL